MAKKGGIFSFLIKLVVFFGFLFYEYQMYEEYKKVKNGVENRKETLYAKVINSFIKREDNFYLDKNYMKEDRKFKEKKRLEAEEKRLEELRKLEELKAIEEQKKLEAEKLAEDKLKENSLPSSNEIVEEKKESKPIEKIVEKPKVQESIKKEEVVKKVNKTVSKENKETIPKGAVNIKKTKIESIEKTTKKREDLPKVKIHEVKRVVEIPKEKIDIKEEQKDLNIKNEQPKKEKSSGFKEIEMLGN